MTPEDALPLLQEQLRSAGFNPNEPSLPVLWNVLRRWVAQPVQGLDPAEDSDMIAYEATLANRLPDEPEQGSSFTLEFTRQFMQLDDDGEYLGMEQIVVRVDYPPHPAFVAITPAHNEAGTASQFWGQPGAASEAWTRRVESDRSFLTAIEHTPVEVSFSHEEV